MIKEKSIENKIKELEQCSVCGEMTQPKYKSTSEEIICGGCLSYNISQQKTKTKEIKKY